MMEWKVFIEDSKGYQDHVDSVFYTESCDADYVLRCLRNEAALFPSGIIKTEPVGLLMPWPYPHRLSLEEVNDIQMDGELPEDWVEHLVNTDRTDKKEVLHQWRTLLGLDADD